MTSAKFVVAPAVAIVVDATFDGTSRPVARAIAIAALLLFATYVRRRATGVPRWP